jgi:hypothetical protein
MRDAVTPLTASVRLRPRPPNEQNRERCATDPSFHFAKLDRGASRYYARREPEINRVTVPARTPTALSYPPSARRGSACSSQHAKDEGSTPEPPHRLHSRCAGNFPLHNLQRIMSEIRSTAFMPPPYPAANGSAGCTAPSAK